MSVWYDGTLHYPDPTHTVPRTEKTTDSAPVILRIGEIEFFHKLYGSEYVEDFRYSHGTELAYPTPGESNAIDGYIIFEVPYHKLLIKPMCRLSSIRRTQRSGNLDDHPHLFKIDPKGKNKLKFTLTSCRYYAVLPIMRKRSSVLSEIL
jgi:hypothetical protein